MWNPFKTPPVKAYWWKEVPNFGDALAPLLLERFADIKVRWGTVFDSKIVSVGSVLEHIPPLWDGIILGAGRLIENSRLQLEQMGCGVTTAKILAIRGPLSAKGIPGKYAIGDPGLLADELVGIQDKQWDLGILPHFSDYTLADKFTSLIPPEYSTKVISPNDHPIKVLKEIGACRRIVTSSLHGIILADAFGIPRRLEYSETLSKDGGDFKFRDYSASIDLPLEFGKMQEPSRVKIEDVKFALYDAYRELKCLL